MSEDKVKQIPLAFEDFEEQLLSVSEISSLASSNSSLSPPPPTIPIREISLIERRGRHIGELKIDERKYTNPYFMSEPSAPVNEMLPIPGSIHPLTLQMEIHFCSCRANQISSAES